MWRKRFQFLYSEHGNEAGIQLFNTCLDWILGRAVGKNHCGPSIESSKVNDLVFANDAAMITECLESLVLLKRQCTRQQKLWNSRSPRTKTKYRYLETYCMTQYSLFLSVEMWKGQKSWRISLTSVA